MQSVCTYYWLLLFFLCKSSTGLEDVAVNVVNGTEGRLSFQDPYSRCPTDPRAHGVYTVILPNLEPFQVSCDAKIAGPGWTVIARRTSNELFFFRDWEEYKRGFGDITSDFFIGLHKLHAITKGQPQELYVHLEDFEGNTRYAQYDEFFIESENEYYRMSKLGRFTGNAGDSMTYSKNQKFTTYDRDNANRKDNRNCAVDYMGPWWHNSCTFVNPFGMYMNGEVDSMRWKGAFWHGFRGMDYSLKVIKMMVRPKCTCSTYKE